MGLGTLHADGTLLRAFPAVDKRAIISLRPIASILFLLMDLLSCLCSGSAVCVEQASGASLVILALLSATLLACAKNSETMALCNMTLVF